MAACSLAGCAHRAWITNAETPSCHASLAGGIASILVENREPPEVARALGERAATVLADTASRPRGFFVPAPSRVTYYFLVDDAEGGCLLRHFRRVGPHGGRVSNMAGDFLGTRALPGCGCSQRF